MHSSYRSGFSSYRSGFSLTSNKGFTLIELLVVVLIIGILSAVALPQYQKAVEKTRFTEAIQNIAAIQKGIEALCLANPNFESKVIGCFDETENNKCGVLDIDVESTLICDQNRDERCRSKHFAYEAYTKCSNTSSVFAFRCQNGDCENKDEQYHISMTYDLNGTWTKNGGYDDTTYPYSKPLVDSWLAQ